MAPKSFAFKNSNSQSNHNNNSNNNNNNHRPLVKLEIQLTSPSRSDVALLVTAIKTGDLQTVNQLAPKKDIDLVNVKDSDGKSALDLALERLGASPESLQITTCIVNLIALAGDKKYLAEKALPLISEHLKKVKEREDSLKMVEQHTQIMLQTNLSSAPKSSHEVGLGNARNISQVDLSGNKRDRTRFDTDDDIDESGINGGNKFGQQGVKMNFSLKKESK